MRPIYFLTTGAVLASAVFMASCVDDNYDLSDIDTTVQVGVTDLVIPINLDEIQLKSVIDIDENDEHIKIINDQYCYVSDGTFSSDPIKVNSFTVNAPSIDDSNFSITTATPGLPMPNIDVKYDIDNVDGTTLNLNASGVTSDICAVDRAYGNIQFTIKFSLGDLSNVANKVSLNGVKLQLPQGFAMVDNAMGAYDANTGVFTLYDLVANTQTGVTLTLQFTSVEIGDRFDAQQHKLAFSSQIGLMPEGSLNIASGDIKTGAAMPQTIALKLSYDLNNFSVKSIDGKIKHPIENLNIPDVEINDLPDILAQEGTKLLLSNPCIYLNVNNPLQSYDVYAQTNMLIQAYHSQGTSPLPYTTDGRFDIGRPVVASGVYNLCLSPKAPADPDQEYAANLQHVPFTSLTGVLAGQEPYNSIPDRLSIELQNPELPEQSVANFELGHNFEGIHGNYKFIAPFNLQAGSQIKYKDDVTGWASEDLNCVTITKLEVNMNVTTDVPVGVDFTGYPIDVNGNKINGVNIVGAKVAANAQNEPLTISIEGGEINGLDGISFVAVATATDGQTLSPNMTIKLTNIRPKATGYYKKEL